MAEIIYLGTCPTYWGSHGCNLDDGHEGLVHVCGDEEERCSEMVKISGDGDAAVRYMTFNPKVTLRDPLVGVEYDEAGWSEWMPSRWFS